MKRFGWCAAVSMMALVACGASETEYVDEGTVCFYTDGTSVKARVIFEAQQKVPQKNQSASCTAKFDGKTITVTSNARYEENDGVDGLPNGPYSTTCVLEGNVPAGTFEVRHGTFTASQTFPVAVSSCK